MTEVTIPGRDLRVRLVTWRGVPAVEIKAGQEGGIHVAQSVHFPAAMLPQLIDALDEVAEEIPWD